MSQRHGVEENPAEAERRLRVADRELNRLYKELLGILDVQGRGKVHKAQRAWLAFRDANCAYEADGYRVASLSKMQRTDTAARMTEARVKEVKVSLEYHVIDKQP